MLSFGWTAAGDDAEISIPKAFVFVIGASCSLLLIFYFLDVVSVACCASHTTQNDA